MADALEKDQQSRESPVCFCSTVSSLVRSRHGVQSLFLSVPHYHLSLPLRSWQCYDAGALFLVPCSSIVDWYHATRHPLPK
ncbi:hypothetical protein M440DRAFT_1194475 [Trichoderma longibrachiatum ATCC 18648]|uniref:Uncharacterized protein n=1 Tax=Trichoderma longibrachiatum ATCC 18648 TaxID=983965 RepID=A0A2T4CA80_TRILO|nr:hypothetical protein M440DRAFT_1194475 [Trichoderma longibrachiatum ATCC 18648]